jgi:hypothetical protein
MVWRGRLPLLARGSPHLRDHILHHFSVKEYMIWFLGAPNRGYAKSGVHAPIWGKISTLICTVIGLEEYLLEVKSVLTPSNKVWLINSASLFCCGVWKTVVSCLIPFFRSHDSSSFDPYSVPPSVLINVSSSRVCVWSRLIKSLHGDLWICLQEICSLIVTAVVSKIGAVQSFSDTWDFDRAPYVPRD